jgi:hypothetical protein
MELQGTELINQEWRNANAHRHYPFADHARLAATDSTELPDLLFEDARIYLIGAGPDVYLSEIKIGIDTVTVRIQDASGVYATGSFTLSAPASGEIALYDQYGRPAGVLVSTYTKLVQLPTLFPAQVNFTASATPFAASCVVPQPQTGLRGILLDDGTFLSGDVYLAGEDGIVLSIPSANTIRIDVIGNPYQHQEECDEEGIAVPAFRGLRTINGIAPDPVTGDFKFSAGANPPYAADNIVRINLQEQRILTFSLAGSEGFAHG